MNLKKNLSLYLRPEGVFHKAKIERMLRLEDNTYFAFQSLSD